MRAHLRAGLSRRLSTLQNAFEFTETVLFLPGLDPRHQGLRIAQLSDIHVGSATPASRIQQAVRAVALEEPDLVFLTGDYVTHSKRPVARIAELLKGLPPDRTFAVLGNHDHWVDPVGVRRAISGLGYGVLQNERASLELRGARLAVLGIDDALTRNDDVAKTFSQAPRTGTRLVLAHAPTTADDLPEGEGLACFSGHTHGGQVHLPGVTAAVFRFAGQPYVRGLYRVRGNLLYVNRGLGFGLGGPLMRFGSKPEVAFFTLAAS